MRTIDDPALVDSWNDAMKEQRVKKAVESQSIDLTLLASTPMHDRLTFERAQAVEEKMAERVRRNGGVPGKSYQGWMAEVERQAAHHEQRRRCGGIGLPLASSASKKRGRQPSPNRCVGVICRAPRFLSPLLRACDFYQGSVCCGGLAPGCLETTGICSAGHRDFNGIG
jgi:hypothetical protein